MLRVRTERLHEVVKVLAAGELVAFPEELFTGHDDRGSVFDEQHVENETTVYRGKSIRRNDLATCLASGRFALNY